MMGSYRLRREKWKACGGICCLCDRPVKWVESTLEHIVPKSKGGTDDPENLGISHQECNDDRRNMPIEEYRKKIRLKYKPLGVTKATATAVTL